MFHLSIIFPTELRLRPVKVLKTKSRGVFSHIRVLSKHITQIGRCKEGFFTFSYIFTKIFSSLLGGWQGVATTGGGVVHFVPQEGVDDALLAGCALYLHPHSQLRWGHCGGHSLLKREPPPHPRRETRGRSNLAPGPPNGQKGGAAAPPLWIPHPEGRGSGSGKRSWSSPIFARFCNSDSRGRKLIQVLHPARDLAGNASPVQQFSLKPYPQTCPVGQVWSKAISFGPCTARFLWRNQRKWGVQRKQAAPKGCKS